MRWKMIGMSLLAAGLAAGCSSSGTHARNHSYDHDNYYSSNDSSWGSLSTGMTKTQVINRIGSPNQRKQFKSGKGTWYYTDGGQVNFNKQGRVSSWKDPRSRTYSYN